MFLTKGLWCICLTGQDQTPNLLVRYAGPCGDRRLQGGCVVAAQHNEVKHPFRGALRRAAKLQS